MNTDSPTTPTPTRDALSARVTRLLQVVWPAVQVAAVRPEALPAHEAAWLVSIPGSTAAPILVWNDNTRRFRTGDNRWRSFCGAALFDAMEAWDANKRAAWDAAQRSV